jgi:hypothetical protein
MWIPRGQPAVFALANKTAVVQAMRALGRHVARLLHSMDDGWEPYWRDTILIQPGRSAMSRSSPTTRANGRSNRLSPNTARLEWEPGFRWCEAPDPARDAESKTRGAKPLQETAR